jgi:hypothetical protein
LIDTEVAAIREKEELKRLEQQVEDMLLSLDYKQLIKELDYNCYLSRSFLFRRRKDPNIVQTKAKG